MKRFSHSRGFTMIELMISLVLGLLVAAAATQLLLTNATSFSQQRGISDVQDNGRFALDFINRDVRAAGMRPDGAFINPFLAVVVDAAEMPGASADWLTANGVSATGLGSSDQLLIQRLTLEDTVDCEGNAVTAGNYVVSRYFLRADVGTNAESALACDGGWHDQSALSNVGDAGVVLLGAVENMQVLLGTGLAGYPMRYLRPDEYALLAAPRPPVLVVRLGVMVSSVDRSGPQMGDAPDLNVLDQLVDDVPGDGRIRRVFVTSIALRNEL
ncbi:MAG: PilW family protein [Moraxellaceae bacterium]|nr:PilW family protein [Moraxellaceae bacterium]